MFTSLLNVAFFYSPSDVTQRKYIGFQLDKLYDVLEAAARLQITVYGADGKVCVFFSMNYVIA